MKIVKNATGVIEIRNSTTNELEKFFDPTGMIVNDHPRAADCICVSKTPAEQDETESINIRISDVTHVGGVEFTGETRASLKEALVLLFKAGGGNGTGVANINVQSVASAATVTPAAGNDLVVITAQAEGLTLANPTGIWVEGQEFLVRIKDNGTPRAISFGAAYRAIGVTLPTTTVATKTTYIGIVYNWVADKWDIIGVTTQA